MSDDREPRYHKEDRRPGREPEPEPESEVIEDPATMSDETPEEPSVRGAVMEPDLATEGAEEPHSHGTPESMEIDVYALLRMSLGMFAEQAWVQMGLQLAPGAKELKTDLHQARVAIDTVNFMKEALGSNLNAEEKREVDQLLANLRMNYLQRT
ncbi:MAG: DUF1844 domain-containing protein [Armatimonadota bacterium]